MNSTPDLEKFLCYVDAELMSGRNVPPWPSDIIIPDRDQDGRDFILMLYHRWDRCKDIYSIRQEILLLPQEIPITSHASHASHPRHISFSHLFKSFCIYLPCVYCL